MEKIMCKKDFCRFKKGEIYDYWTNFGGLNHFVSDGIDEIPFDGPSDLIPLFEEIIERGPRNWIYDYFYTKEEMRDLKINLIFAQ